MEDDWGHPPTDTDFMCLYGGRLGVHVPDGHRERRHSCLTFRPEGCPVAYTKLEISDPDNLKKDEWCKENCVEDEGGRMWLDIFKMLKQRKGSCDKIVGPAIQSPSGLLETVHTLVCSGPHPELEQEYRHRSRGPWPPRSLINYIMQLPMLLVLVGHKLSPHFTLQPRLSWSPCELKLIQELSESVRQGYIACKYVLKRFLSAHRGQNESSEGRSCVGSYHMKTVFLHFLEKRPSQELNSPFGLFLDLLHELDHYFKVGKLPHYFIAQCDLLETVDDDELRIARQVIGDIVSNPLHALLTSPIRPQQVYGKVRPDDLVVAFCKVSSHPTCEQSLKTLSGLLAHVDGRREQTYREQREWDRDLEVSGRPELIKLVDTLNIRSPENCWEIPSTSVNKVVGSVILNSKLVTVEDI